MSVDLATVIDSGRDSESLESELFLATASQAAIRAGWVLSISIALQRDRLHTVVAEAWDDQFASANGGISELASWPFVQEGAEGLRVIEAVRAHLAATFASEDPAAFAKAHESLVRIESAAEISQPEEDWFVRGRVAFYLAGIKPDIAMQEFGELFATAPSHDRIACRIWVSSLVLRQEPLLAEQARELAFYRAFRAYVMGARSEALPLFEAVVESDLEDTYSAIALHLIGVILRNQDPDRAVEVVTRSITLSRRLNLTENEVMARNSLAWALISRSRVLPEKARQRDLRAATVAAKTALSITSEPPRDQSLALFSSHTWAVAQWLELTDGRRTYPSGARQTAMRLAKFLDGIRVEATRANDYEMVISVGNSAASFLAETGRYNDALTTVEAVLSSIHWTSEPPAQLGRLASTTGAVVARASKTEHRERARSILAALDRIAAGQRVQLPNLAEETSED